MKVQCSRCSTEHDLEHMEPSFALPDVAFGLPMEERKRRVRASKDFCQVLVPYIEHPRCFLRVLLQFTVAGRLRPCRWGLWVEVDRETFNRVMDLWEDDARVQFPPLRGTIANALPGYAGSLGLAGSLRFTNLTDIVYLTLDDGDHALIVDHRNGVPAERAIEWLVNIAHGEAG